MGVHLSLPNASILRLRGWGMVAKPSVNSFRVELADIGELAVYQPWLLREKKVMSMFIEHLRLTTETDQITTGGGWRGGGFGLTGALLGSAQAKILNALSTRTDEYTFLAVLTTLPNGTQRDAVFAFRLSESDLRDKRAAALGPWADAYVRATVTNPGQDTIREHDLEATHAKYDRMEGRGVLNAAQARALRSSASKPFVAAILQNLRAGWLNHQEAQKVKARINNMQQHGRLTQHQAHQIQQHLTHIITPPKPARPDADRLRQVQALAELRRAGALTESEFQAEKARLLEADTEPV